MSPPREGRCHMEELPPAKCDNVVEATKPPPNLEEALEAPGEAGLWMIGKLMQVAKLAGSEAHAGGAAEKCAILPRESKTKLVLSDISLKLDRVRRFLEHEVGYVLLDDAGPCAGGVNLQAAKGRRRKGPGPVAPDPKGNAPEGQDEETEKQDQEHRLPPDMARFNRFPDNLVLVSRFMDTLTGCSSKAKGNTLCKTVLQGVRLMHSCKYSYADIVLTLAYTSVYFNETVAHVTQNMCDYEAAHVCALLMYLAHSFILDETCPLRFWQQSIFKHYCTLKILDKALFRLFRLLNFQLRISAEQEQRALSIMLRDTADGMENINLLPTYSAQTEH